MLLHYIFTTTTNQDSAIWSGQSVSTVYVNHILSTVYSAGLWEEPCVVLSLLLQFLGSKLSYIYDTLRYSIQFFPIAVLKNQRPPKFMLQLARKKPLEKTFPNMYNTVGIMLQNEPLGSSLKAMFTVWQHGLQNLLLTATIFKIQVSPTKYALP